MPLMPGVRRSCELWEVCGWGGGIGLMLRQWLLCKSYKYSTVIIHTTRCLPYSSRIWEVWNSTDKQVEHHAKKLLKKNIL